MDIVLASANPGKIRELKAIMEGLAVRVHPQSEFEIPPVDETGTTFVENAIIKARPKLLFRGSRPASRNIPTPRGNSMAATAISVIHIDNIAPTKHRDFSS